MKNKKYEISPVKDFKQWDLMVAASKQGNVFLTSWYVSLAAQYWQAFYVTKGEKIKAGILVILDEAQINIIQDELIIHSGLIFNDEPNQKYSKATAERYEITVSTIDWLAKKFKQITIALSPGIDDMRPFLWYNYDDERINRHFLLNLRYTSFLSIEGCEESNLQTNTVFRHLDTQRQQDIRKAIKFGVRTFEAEDVDTIVDLYAKMMSSNSSKQSPDKLIRLTNLIRGAVLQGFGAIFFTQNTLGQVLYVTFFVWDEKRAYYILGAPGDLIRERYRGSIALWQSFALLRSKNIVSVDFEGVNSPSRGNFKLSFGGHLVPYFEVKKNYE